MGMDGMLYFGAVMISHVFYHVLEMTRIIQKNQLKC